MSTELAARTSVLADQMDYAKAVATGDMLPAEYRGKPANVLIAIGLGQAMGLSQAESLYRISVIKGKPSASAELIASNVRKAGHKLRVRGDETTCTATITRADDPDFEYSITRDLAWARGMELASNPNYKKQPGTMLQWRAITAVARLACPEALYGVVYTPDEVSDLADTSDAPVANPARSGASRLAAAVGVTSDPVEAEVVEAPSEAVETGPRTTETPASDGFDEFHPATTSNPDTGELRSAAQSTKLFVLFGKHFGKDEVAARAWLNSFLGADIASTKDLTKSQASRAIEELENTEPAPVANVGESLFAGES